MELRQFLWMDRRSSTSILSIEKIGLDKFNNFVPNYAKQMELLVARNFISTSTVIIISQAANKKWLLIT